MLSPSQKAKIAALAKDLGVDEAELMKEAEDLAGEPADEADDAKEDAADPKDDEGGDEPAKPTEPPKVFQYHLPYLRVKEVRKLIGFTEAVEDDEMFTGPWLLKHGGQPGGAPPSTGNDGEA